MLSRVSGLLLYYIVQATQAYAQPAVRNDFEMEIKPASTGAFTDESTTRLRR
jgi:hypothetical protein